MTKHESHKSHKSHKDDKSSEKFLFGMNREDFNKENFFEGAIIRPGVLMLAFVAFIFAMFFLLSNNYKWGGSLIIFSFVLNLYAIYQSLTDEESIFRNMNIVFKLVLFIFEIIAFNWLLANI